MKLGDYVSIKQAAELSGYSERHLRNLIRDDKLDKVKVGSMWFVTETSLRSYMAKADEKKRSGVDKRYKSQDSSEG